MKERGPWRLWSTFLLLLAGNLCTSVVQSQSYDGARGDAGDTSPQALGFSGVVSRHDGYVKGETPTIPQTSFACSAQPYNPGLYADIETQCQVYHVCFEDRQESFLCGPGTNFNQRILACDFWYNFDCQDSPSFYAVNADIGKVPDKVYKPGQSRDPSQPQQPRPQQPRPQQPQQPSYPSFPQQPAQPPSVGSYPPHVSVPPPPPPRPAQPRPQPPSIPQPPPFRPEPPRVPQQQFIPKPPPFRPAPPRVRPQPQPPRDYPQPQPQPPRDYPQPQPQPPRDYPEPIAPRPQPPVFRPDPPTHISVQPSYPRIPQGSGQPSKVRPPPTQQLPPTQQEDDAGYVFDGYNPPRPSLPAPQPPRSQPPRPVFPPVVSPPRVSRPPLTPAIIRQPEIHRPRVPTIDTRSEYHPDSQLKGNAGYQPPRIPQPSRPVSSGYPGYPVAQRPVVQKPVEKPSRPAYRPPATVQQEHVDTEYVPLPPKEPSRPETSYVPPPPPPPPHVQQEIGFTKPPPKPSRPVYVPPPVEQKPSRPAYVPPPVEQKPSRPVYVPPPVAQKPVDNDYGRPQPPVAPSVIREQQKPAVIPPSRPQVTVGSRQPSRPKPVFPPASDHPNSNIKGGPGYNQPPPQVPRFEPTRISRPSIPQGGYQEPPQPPRPPKPVTVTEVKATGDKTPAASGQGAYKPPIQRIKKPSEPPRSIYQPPIQVIDHPRSEIKGVVYDPPRQPQRVQSPSTQITGVKRPQVSGNGHRQQPQIQRPRAPVVVSRPQPPSLPTTSVKKTTPVDSQVYEKPLAPARVKQPSTSVQTVSRPRFPQYEDHPNANVKGGSGYNNHPRLQPVGVVPRPSSPPSSPSTSYEQKTTSTNQGRGTGTGYPRGDIGSVEVIQQEVDYKPSRSSPPSSVKTVQKIMAVKDTGSYQKPASVSEHSVLINKQSKPDYEAGSSYTRGPETYPKPEFGKPHQPVSSPSRVGTKQGSPSQNTITRSQNKPAYQGVSVSTGSGSGSDVRPDYPFNRVPGHQPPHERQVFPHRENPDHPNESLKGSSAYRPPPPAGFQASASEVQEQNAVPEPEPSSSLHGDTGSE